MDDKEYKAGDIVFIVRFPLVIKCTITEVDFQFRKRHPAGFLFYDVDEPIGHNLAADELFDTFNGAAASRAAYLAELKEEFGHIPLEYQDFTLEAFRESHIKFIKSTHITSTSTKEEIELNNQWWDENPYPLKLPNIDWWNVTNLNV